MGLWSATELKKTCILENLIRELFTPVFLNKMQYICKIFCGATELIQTATPSDVSQT
jgi:hypothetical protein